MFFMMGTIEFEKLKQFVFSELLVSIPQSMHYHSLNHTKDVLKQVELIGCSEGCVTEDILLLKTAALFHDIGYLYSYENHEQISCEICEYVLPDYNYSETQIRTICRLILATKMPHHPNDLLERIICDSDLDYLGRDDFSEISFLLFRELEERKVISTIKEWDQLQLKFISNHSYFTDTAIKRRDNRKKMHVDLIRKRVSNFN